MAAPGNHDAGLVKALIAGIVANFLVAVSKFVAFLFTGSSAMLAEALHSFADSSNQGLLALGLKRGAMPASDKHPFGYSVERFFWAFIVSILIFLLGGAFAIYEGTHKLMEPSEIKNPIWSFGALGFGMVVEAFALKVAWEEFKHFRAENPGPVLQALKDCKDPTLPTVLFEDSAALFGLTVAAIGVALTVLTGNPIHDAIATICIGVILVGVAGFLAVESHSLLVGEAASTKDQKRIRDVVTADEAVESVVEMLTLQRGPRDILVALTLDFKDDLQTNDLELAILRIEGEIQAIVPDARHVFIEAGSFRQKKS